MLEGLVGQATTIAAILGLVVVAIVASATGHDGPILTACIGGIAGLGGGILRVNPSSRRNTDE